MPKFQVWQGNYADLSKILPGCAFFREGFLALVVSEDPRHVDYLQLTEKLHHYRRGLIKYRDEVFYYDAMAQVPSEPPEPCDFYISEHLPSDVSQITRAGYYLFEEEFVYINPLQKKIIPFTLDSEQQVKLHRFFSEKNKLDLSVNDLQKITEVTGHVHVRDPAKLVPITGDALDDRFAGLSIDEERVFTEDVDIEWFNRWRGCVRGNRLRTSADLKSQVEKDLNRQNYISFSDTAEDLKTLIRESSVYRSYLQGNVDGRVFTGEHLTFLQVAWMEKASNPSHLLQGTVNAFYVAKGVPSGIAITYLRDDSDTEIPLESRKKIYCMAIIKNVLEPDPLQRKVTYITYAEEIPGVPFEPLSSAVESPRSDVLTEMQEAIGSEAIYQLFSQPLLEEGQFFEPFESLANRLPENGNLDDRDVRKKAFEDLLSFMRGDVGIMETSVFLQLMRYKTDVDFFEEHSFGKVLSELRLQHRALIPDKGKQSRFESQLVDVWLQVKRHDPFYKSCQEKLQREPSSLLKRLVSIMVKSEWLAFQCRDNKEALALAETGVQDATRWINELSKGDESSLLEKVRTREQKLAEEDTLEDDLVIQLSVPERAPRYNAEGAAEALTHFLNQINKKERNDDVIIHAKELHKAVAHTMKKRARHWHHDDWRSLVQMLEHCSQALDNPTNFNEGRAIVTSAEALLKRHHRLRLGVSALSLATVLFWTGIAITLTVPVAAPVFFVSAAVFLGLAVLSVALYNRYQQQALAKPAADYVTHVKGLGVFAQSKPESKLAIKPATGGHVAGAPSSKSREGKA